jgi:hypothetical protein
MRRRRNRKAWLAPSALLLLLGATFGARWLSPGKIGPPADGISPSASFWETPDVRPARLGSERPVYRHSIIPGGAYSVSELEWAERRDPVVAAHYARFEHANLRMVQNPAARAVYVSYRVGDGVYWTRGRVQLPAAETLITDGENEARARCGNRVSDTPRQPTMASQPPASALDESEGAVFVAVPEAIMPPGPQLAEEIFPVRPPLQMAIGGVAAPGGSAGVSSGSGGGYGGGFAAWGGGGGAGLTPGQTAAPQAPVGQVAVPRVSEQPLPQSIPVVWVASATPQSYTLSLVSSSAPASAGQSALASSPPVLLGTSFTPGFLVSPTGGEAVPLEQQPVVPASVAINPPANPSGGSGGSNTPPQGDSPNSPQPGLPPKGPDAPEDTPEPATGLLAAAGALALAGLAAFRNRRNRTG